MKTADLREFALSAADRMPFAPVVFQRTLALFSKGDEVSVGELAGVVEHDVVIAGSLLSIANSTLYSRTGSVCSVRNAIARIGIYKTRDVLLGLSISRAFRAIRLPKTWSSARFNTHSLATAILTDLLVQRAPTENAEWAFLAGFLHDIGLLLIATAFPDQSLDIADAGSDYQLIERERELLGFTHFEIGADLLVRWNCPAIVRDASVFCQSTTFEYQNPLKLGMVVKTASMVADANGISMFGSKEDLSLLPELLEALSIQKPTTFIEMFRAEYNGLQGCVT
jgi:HD-like signal output (HDOD) protein